MFGWFKVGCRGFFIWGVFWGVFWVFRSCLMLVIWVMESWFSVKRIGILSMIDVCFI